MTAAKDPPREAERDAWYAYRAAERKLGNDPDEHDQEVFRAGWRQGARFTIGATSMLAPALESFMRWLEYVTDWQQSEAVTDVDVPQEPALEVPS